MKTTESVEGREQLSRQLTSAQLAMIAIGGAIGTGLFLGSSLAVRVAGPGEDLRVFSTDEFKPPPDPGQWRYPPKTSEPQK